MNEAQGRWHQLPQRHAQQVAASVGRILQNQHESGAFVASPDFAQYRYCWLRDGSFTAYALDRVGEVGAAERFHKWAGAAVLGVSGLIEAAVQRAVAGLPPEEDEMPPARFSLEGLAVADDWPNFQVDGYGTWLWSLRQHLLATGTAELPPEMRPAVGQAARYLEVFGTAPCYDVWEEDRGSVHTATLACVHGGLCAAAEMLGDASLALRATQVREMAVGRAHRDGAFCKSDHSSQVDGALLWLSQPFQVVPARDPAMAETAWRISAELDLDGGTRRYPSDTYYGGGAWPVLTASLGWHYASTGDLAGANRCLDWVAARFDSEGRLGEQFGGERRDPASYRRWVERWGPPAADLLWSHAMYILLAVHLAGFAPPGESPAAQPEPAELARAALRQSPR
jgi:GH15 family glucan-1,4-alpha-glucosidase